MRMRASLIIGSRRWRQLNNVLYLVVPCYNEEAVLVQTAEALLDKYREMTASAQISPHSRILFVDDGSADATWQIITMLSGQYPAVMGLKLSRNRGHQNALFAGMMYAREHCDMMISIDADLQDDVEALSAFVEKYHEGCDIVYGVRSERKKDTFFKRATAQGFYRFMNLMGAETVYNHADYRLMSRRALEALSEYRETGLFLRGVVPLIGQRSDSVYYARRERAAGETKYPLKKMLNFALDGITSFSVKPLRLISVFGMLCSLLSVGGLLYALISYFFGYTVPGWTAITCSIWLLGGIQLLGIGVLGEYIGKIFSEVKQRPRYHIEAVVSHSQTETEKTKETENSTDRPLS